MRFVALLKQSLMSNHQLRVRNSPRKSEVRVENCLPLVLFPTKIDKFWDIANVISAQILPIEPNNQHQPIPRVLVNGSRAILRFYE